MALKVTPAEASLDGAHLPFDEQIAFFQAKLGNLIPTRTWRDVRHAQHDTGFMVAGAAKADLLSDFAQAVDSTIAEGKSLQWFRGAFDAIVEEHGWSHTGGRDWRSKVIYQTNMATSYAAGRLAQLRDPELQKLAPFWMYVHNDSVLHPRPQHLAWNGLTLPADDPWFKTHYPPNGWGCMCRVTAVSKTQATRDGGRFGPAPDDGINEKTGTPVGIDRGFDYMPGDTVTDRIRQTLLEKAAKLPEAIGAALVEDLANIPKAPPVAGRVSDALDLPKSGIAKKATETVLVEIDAIHSVGPLPTIPVVNSTAHTSRYVYTLPTFSAKQISVTKLSAEPELSAAHEIGHFIDHQSINAQRGFASKADPLLEEWRAAVGNSKAATGLLDNAKNGSKLQRDNANYYLKTHEAWARSYAQYIAERGGNAKMKEQLEAILRDTGNPKNQFRQWDPDDFKPIAQAIDALFAKLGWLK